MHIRPATAADAEAFAHVVAAVADEGRWIATEPPVDIAARAALVGAWIDRGDRLLLLEDDGGRALMDAAMTWLAASDMHKVELEVWPDNERAIALYERYGFEVEGLRRDHYRRRDGSLRSALIMARLLRREAGT